MDKTVAFFYFPLINLHNAQSVEKRISDFRESEVEILDETFIEKSAMSMVVFRYEDGERP